MLCPGRDTQDDGLLFYIVSLYGTKILALLSALLHGFRARCAYWAYLFFEVVTGYFVTLVQGSRVDAFERKHGRWKHSKFYPSCFMLLSLVAIQACQVPVALSNQTGQAWRLGQ